MKKTEDEKLPGGITQEQLEAWKLKYGESKVFQVDIPTDDAGKNVVTGYFKKPNLNIIGAAGKFSATDMVKSGLVLFDGCWLGGDDEVKTDDEVKFSAINALNKLFKLRVATIKNV